MSAPRRAPRRIVDGVLLLDKPTGCSSNHALQAARRAFNAAKAGHTGTLDPLASGLLPLTFGEATKFSQMLLEADKEYVATVQLGVATATGDAEGEVLARAPVAVDAAMLEAALATFRGPIEQLPPMYSALKRDGKPLYEYARAGIEVERAPRAVTIHALELLAFRPDEAQCELRMRCSKGTYIRSLAIDLGAALGCGAHLAALRRTAIGSFTLDGAVALATLEAATEHERDAWLLPADALVVAFPAWTCSAVEAERLLQGGQCRVNGTPGTVRLYAGARFLGLGEIDLEGVLRPRRLIRTDIDSPSTS